MTSPYRLVAAALALCLAASIGCGGSSASSEPDAGSGGTAGDAGGQDAAGGGPFTGTMQCGSIPVASPHCADCADEWCCDQGNACAEHQDCLDLRECRRGCTPSDLACQDGCEALHPQGASYDAALTSCRMHSCAGECFDGAAVSCGFSVAPSACQSCAQLTCCDVGYAAHLDPAFWDYDTCLRGCADVTCQQACASDQMQGYLQYATWIGCLGTACPDACGISPAYTCGGSYEQPCASCVGQSCCTQSEACFEDPACIGINLCARACATGDTACLDGCKGDATAGATWQALYDCLAGPCGADCGS